MRIVAILLCALMIFSLFGCAPKEKFNTPVAFYYCLQNINHSNEKRVFDKEIHEGKEFTNDLVGLLNIYLKGPSSVSLYSPFPIKGQILGSKQEGNVLTLYLSEQFDRLPIDKLSLSIACLAQTVFEYASALILVLIPSGSFVDGTTYKTITADSFIYTDSNVNYSSIQ